LSIKGIHEVAFTILHNTSMKLLGSEVFDSHTRLGSTSFARQLDEVVLDLILLEVQQLLASITHYAFNAQLNDPPIVV